MSDIPLFQRMYIRQQPVSIRTTSNPLVIHKTIDRIHLMMSVIIGILIAAIILSVLLTLYLDNHRTIGLTTTTTTTTAAQIPSNQPNSSDSTQRPYYCSRISSYTLWTTYSDTGITMNIDTSNCTFNSTPLYFTSIAGISSHWDLIGYGAIYSATPSSFMIYARSFSGLNSTVLLTLATARQWNVNWFGILE